jgi:hypothetical protein
VTLKPAKPIARSALTRPGQVFLAGARLCQVDQLVVQVDAVFARFLFLHGRGHRVLDAAADQAHQQLARFGGARRSSVGYSLS